MEEIKLNLNKDGEGGFYLTRDGRQLGQMVLQVKGNIMTIFHTEVVEEEEGKGYAKQLFDDMVKHARANKLTVSVICPYVRVQFMRHQDVYADVWKREADDI